MSVLKKIFASRTFYIVFSAIASLALWMYITYIENPDTPNYVSGIPVQLENADLLTSRNLILTDVSVQTVSIRFYGTRDNVMKLSASNLSVSVDLGAITSEGLHTMQYKINYPSDVDSRSLTKSWTSADDIDVNVENLLDKTVPVTGVYNGGTPDGYMVDTLQFSPDTVTVRGPESVVSQIAGAWVAIPLQNLTKTEVREFPFAFVDNLDREVKSDYLSSDRTTVRVTVPVLVVKDVPLKIAVNPGAGATENNTEVTIFPATIKLSGDESLLSTYNFVPLGTVDLSTFDISTSLSFPIMIPNGMKNLTGLTDAGVSITIHGLDIQHYTVSGIGTTNVQSSKTADIVTKSLDVKIRGKTDELAQIDASNIIVTADVSGLDNGTYSIPAKVYVNSPFTDIGAVGEYKVTVTIADAGAALAESG